jgi:transcriptional regulator with XRE-family HTH domain
LKKIRKKLHLTQRELAAKTGFSVAAIKGYEQDLRRPGYLFLYSLVTRLGVDPENLF